MVLKPWAPGKMFEHVIINQETGTQVGLDKSGVCQQESTGENNDFKEVIFHTIDEEILWQVSEGEAGSCKMIIPGEKKPWVVLI